MENVKIRDLFDLNHTQASDYLSSFEYPWEALTGIKDLVIAIGRGHLISDVVGIAGVSRLACAASCEQTGDHSDCQQESEEFLHDFFPPKSFYGEYHTTFSL